MPENYADWEFSISGNPHELLELSRTRGTDYFRIGGGIDYQNDCHNDDYRLTTMFAQDESDAHIVWQVGYELVGLFNGASVLFDKNSQKISIRGLGYKDREQRWEGLQNSAALLGQPTPFTQSRLDEERRKASELSGKFALLHLATENQDVYFILKYLNMDANWVTYYKFLEAVETFATEKSIDLKTDKAKRKAFTNTSNNFSFSGFGARHGFKQVIKENKTAIMNLEEAHEFVTSVAKMYLKNAY
jgi:hypothetical protein